MENLFFLNFLRIMKSMRKYIIATIIAASLLIPVTAKKVVLDYNHLASSATEKEIKTAYKQEKIGRAHV